MARRRRLAFLEAVLVLALAPAAWALIPGGRLRRTDCFAEWRVARRSLAPTRGVRALDCEDGDPSCDADKTQDGRCTFDVSVCTLQRDPLVPECVAPPALTAIHGLTAGLAMPHPMTAPACGVPTSFAVPLRFGKRPSKGDAFLVARRGGLRPSHRLRLRATAIAGGLRDVNRLALRCLPSSVCPQPACPASSRGPSEPNELTLGVGGVGSDVDLGSSGLGHNLIVPPSTTVHLCLDGCDTTTNPHCDATLLTGAGTANGTLFGPPRPVLTQNVPLCLVSEYAAAATAVGSADLASGAVTATIPLRTKLYLTDATAVCPRCVEGRCADGANVGNACTVDESLSAGRIDDPPYALSRDCLPSGSPVGSLLAEVPLTTGESALADDACDGPTSACSCGATCTGDACIMETTDSVTGALVCLDARGGVSQACCVDDTTRPCFTTPVTRVGRADVPRPPWPDPTYPKTSALAGAATFCMGPSSSTIANLVLGLPGPAAIVLPASATWSTPSPVPCGGGGVPAPY